MKTLREVLLRRHEAVESKLDAIRRNVLVECQRPHLRQTATIPAHGRRNSGGVFAKLWQELVWPCRRIWTGMAAVWLVIFVVNFATRERDLIVVENTPPTPEMAEALKNQRQMMAQLLNPDTTAQPSRPSLPKPRSEQRQAVVSV